MTTTRSHFTFRIDVWTANGESMSSTLPALRTIRLHSPPFARRITLLKRIGLLKGTAAEPTVALPVPLDRMARISSTPLALVRRPMTFLVKCMPRNRVARGSGMLAPARISAAACASRTPMSIAATATKRRARPRSAEPNASCPPARCPAGP
jgi:hypothetical protein